MRRAESLRSLDDLVEIFGPEAAVYLSQDNKSAVHIGFISAKMQSYMLMNMQFHVRLPDHHPAR